MNTNSRAEQFIRALESEGYRFERVSEAPWIAPIEQRFGTKFPELYRYLVTNYTFQEFDAGGLTFYANVNDGAYEDIGVAPFADEYMAPWLISNGYLQFARPDTGSYDPVCFDMSSNPISPRILRFDHEDILLERGKVRRRVLWESLENLAGAKV